MTELKGWMAEPSAPGLAGALVIEGYASLWGVADLNGDVVAQGAFGDSLARTGAGGVRMLHQHESRAVVGVWDEISEDERGLFVRGRIKDWSAEARYATALSRAGALDGLSIGFRAQKARRDGKLRILAQVELWEVSLVSETPTRTVPHRPLQPFRHRYAGTPCLRPTPTRVTAAPLRARATAFAGS